MTCRLICDQEETSGPIQPTNGKVWQLSDAGDSVNCLGTYVPFPLEEKRPGPSYYYHHLSVLIESAKEPEGVEMTFDEEVSNGYF